MAKARPITGLDAHAPIGRIARIIARIRLDELYDWSHYADDPHHVHELHNLRIAAKRLRYTLEIFADVLPDACLSVIKELELIQEELGALHDRDVMVVLLHLCLDSRGSDNISHHTLSDKNEQLVLPLELVADVVNPAVAPVAGERYGLEQFLFKYQRAREEQYNTFQQHWRRLQARDFHQEILDILAAG